MLVHDNNDETCSSFIVFNNFFSFFTPFFSIDLNGKFVMEAF